MTKRKLGLSAFSVAIALVAVGTYLLLAQSAHSQTPVPYSYFQGLSQSDQADVQLKLTFVGISEKPTWSAGIVATDKTFDLPRFTPFQHAGLGYAGDGFEVITCQVSDTDMASIITAAGTVADVANGVNDSAHSLAFSLVHHQQSGDNGFEAVLNATSGGQLLTALIGGLPNGSDCGRVLRQFSATVQEGPGIDSGDANCSGAIDIMDPLNILQYASEARLPNTCLVVGGVPNCDGDPGPEDAIIDLRVLAGLGVTVPPGCPAPGEQAQH
jgi:hypothetical protein